MAQLANEGLTAPAIARERGVSERIVRIWLKRMAQEGTTGLDDARRSGRPHTYTEDVYCQVVAKAHGLPPKPAVQDEENVVPTCH